MAEITGTTVANQPQEGGLKSGMNKLKEARDRHRHRHDPKPGSMQMDRGVFVKEETTHKRLSERGKRRRGAESDKVVINPELQKEYGNFITGYIRNLNRLNAMEGQLLDHPNFRHERDLVGMLSTNGSPDAGKIKVFLESHQGLALTTQLIEEQTALMLFALGLDASPRFGGHGPVGRDFDQRMDPMLVNVGRSGIKRERLGRSAHMFGTDTLGFGRGLGGAAIGGGLGTMFGYGMDHGQLASIHTFIQSIGAGVTSTSFYGMVGVGVGGLVGRRFFLPDGDVDFRVCGEGLRILHSDPRLATYLHEMTGVNPNDFAVVGDKIQRNTNRPFMETGSIKDIKRQIVQNIHSRRMFYEALGYPTTRPGRAPEQLFTNHNIDSRQQWATIWQDRIDKKLDRNGAAFRGMTPQQQREAYMAARREVMAEYIQDFRDQVLRGQDRGGEITSLAEKRDRITDPKEHKAKHEELERRAREDKEYMEWVKRKLYPKKEIGAEPTPREKAQAELEAAVQKLKAIDQTKRAPDALKMIRLAQGDITTLRRSLENLRSSKDEATEKLRLGTLTVPPTEVEYEPESSGKVTTKVSRPKTPTEYFKTIKDTFDEQERGIINQINEAQAMIDALAPIAEEIRLAQKALADLGSEGVSTFATESLESYLDIIASTATARRPITQAELADASITVDDLLERINEAHRARHTGLPNQPWTESENARKELRERLLRARVEAQVRATATFLHPAAEAQYERLVAWGNLPSAMSEEQIANMTVRSLRTAISNFHTNNPIVFPDPTTITDAELQLAIDAAEGRQAFRKGDVNGKGIIDKMIEGLASREAMEKHLTEAFEVPDEALRLEATITMMKRQEEILSGTTDPETFKMQDVVNPVVATRSDRELLDAEKDTTRLAGGVPRGYYVLMDYLFDYKPHANGNEEFGKVQAALNPTVFFEMVRDGIANEELLLEGVNPLAPPANIRDLFTQMETSYQLGQLNERSMRRLSTYIMNRLIARGESIA